MASVTGHKKAKHGRLSSFHVKRAANGGFIVNHQHDMPEDGSPMAPSPEPQVFTKHAPLHKHLKMLAAQMHPPEAGTSDMQGYSPESEQA